MEFYLTNAEMSLFFKYAEGNVAILFMLIAIRCAEQGGPGREMGVMDKRANTIDKQVRWARNTILNKERIYKETTGKESRDSVTKLFTDDFLAFFASRWAPIGAENDPEGLNSNWLKNARFFYSRCYIMLSEVA